MRDGAKYCRTNHAKHECTIYLFWFKFNFDPLFLNLLTFDTLFPKTNSLILLLNLLHLWMNDVFINVVDFTMSF